MKHVIVGFSFLFLLSCDIPNVENIHLSTCLKGECKTEMKLCFDDIERGILECNGDELCAQLKALELETCLDELIDCASRCVAELEEDLKD